MNVTSLRVLRFVGPALCAAVFLAALALSPAASAETADATEASSGADPHRAAPLTVTDEDRRAAEAYWLMMSQMQGVAGADSPVIQSLERRGVLPAPMGERNPSSAGHAGSHSTQAAPRRVWTEREYIEHYNRLGATPPAGGYAQYLARQGVGTGSGEHRFALDSAKAHGGGHDMAAHGSNHDLAAQLGMEGARVRRGRSDATQNVVVQVQRIDPAAAASTQTPESIAGITLSEGPGELRVYDVVAFEKDIVYTRFEDHDPNGLVFALTEDRDRILACQGFECGNDPLFFGSRRDPEVLSPQPLVIRANVGDTVVVNLTNEIPDQRASIHIHKARYAAADSAGSHAGHNPDSTAGPGETLRYTWQIPNFDWAEGIYYFYSHADPRYQVPRGLYGALIVEPRGSSYFDTETGEPLRAGWGAIIANDDPAVPAFREYTVFFQDRMELINPVGNGLQDFYTGVADAGGKGLSYRSAPFFNMMDLFLDESMAYSAYTFGDFSTPHPRWYLGDPMRLRVIHGGSGEHHVFHNHAHRWRVNYDEGNGLENNLTETSKGGEHDLILPLSTRIDSQTLGPGEVFDVFMEGGAGGVQRTVGDVLFHCHIIEHVVEGMWSYHRIFNTLQPDLAPLPDRQPLPEAVTSVELLRRAQQGNPAVVKTGGRFFGEALGANNLRDWITWLLPPAGVPDEELIIDPEHGNRTQNKANKWNWTFQQTAEGLLALGEPYDWFFGPGFPAAGQGVGAGPVGERPPLLFNPDDGRLAWPHLKPHLGRRPPFAPIRDGDPSTQGTAYLGLYLPTGAFGDSGAETGSGLLPELTHPTLERPGQPTPVRHYDITAITLPIQYNDHGDIDPDGAIFALSDDVPDIVAGDKPAEPLVLRSNVGEGVQIRLRSALRDTAEYDFHSKVGMHIHLVQYDVQSSDGAVAGFNYETSVRPSIDNAGNPVAGRRACGIWVPRDCGPLDRSDEVVHTTWFADTELGTVYWHDHSKLVVSLPHGLFAALIVEPEAAEYKDRETGQPKYTTDERGHFTGTNGTTGTQIADILVPEDITDPRTGGKRADFRELFVGFNDATPLFGEGLEFAALEHGESRRNPEKGFPSLNLRNEPFVHRLRAIDDESLVYSSFLHGDPATPLFRAYAGDPIALRTEGGGTNSVHILQFHGHRWRFQRGDPDSSPLRDFVVVGQSEGFSFDFEPGAGGLAGAAGDYLYYDGDMDHRREGAWGLFRVHDTAQESLQPLADRTPPPAGRGFPESVQDRGLNAERPPLPLGPGDPGAPAGAPVRRYDVVAAELPIPYDSFGKGDPRGRMYVLAEHYDALMRGDRPTEPLVIRANAGEVVEVRLENRMESGRVGLHASLVLQDPLGSDGGAVGYNPDQTVAPGESITYRWYADQPLGTVYLYNPASLDHTRHGLFGALIVEPAGSSWTDPATGGPLASGVAADVVPGDGTPPFREFAVFFHDGQDQIRYRVAVNYRTARRLGADEVLPAGPGASAPDDREPSVHSSQVWEDPVTPVLRAYEGDRVIVRLLQPAYEDHHVFHLHGHSWFLEPGDASSQLLSDITTSVGAAYDLELIGGAVAGDHPFHCHIMDHKKMGMWGLMRVHTEAQPDLVPLAQPLSPAVAAGGAPTSLSTSAGDR